MDGRRASHVTIIEYKEPGIWRQALRTTIRSAGDRAPRMQNGFRLAALALVLPLMAVSCASVPASDPNLTPAQNQLRQANANWNNTVATGALGGAVLGAGLGAAVAGSGNRDTGALIGGAGGAVLGALGGLAVANRTYGFASRSASDQDRIANATAVADALEQQSAAARQVVEQNRRILADLDRQFRAQQITADTYRSRAAAIRADVDQMRKGAANGKEARDEINKVSGDLPALRGAEDRIRSAQRRLDASATELDDVLKQVPAI